MQHTQQPGHQSVLPSRCLASAKESQHIDIVEYNKGNRQVRKGSPVSFMATIWPSAIEDADNAFNGVLLAREYGAFPFPRPHRVNLIRRRQLHTLDGITSLGLPIVHAHNVQAVRRERHHAPALAAHEAEPVRAAPQQSKGQGGQKGMSTL